MKSDNTFFSQNAMHNKSYDCCIIWKFQSLGEHTTHEQQSTEFLSVRASFLESTVTNLSYFELPTILYL